MQSKHGIAVDVLCASTPNRVPLNCLLESGVTLVKVPHGAFKVRIKTPHPTDITIALDEQGLLQTQVPAGMTELAMGKDGRPLMFQPASETRAPVSAPVEPIPTEGFSPDISAEVLAQVTKDGVVGGEAALAATQPAHISGFLVVSVRFTEQTPIPGIVPPPYDEDQVAFQMNPPADHNRMVAANFNKIVPPEKIEKRWCSCCRRLDDRR